jgi:DNA-binding transcriptional MerR regulator
MAEAASMKAPDAFRTISEVAQDLELPQHVLRFWETRFGQIKPMKRGGGRRYYRPEDVDLLRGIRLLLYGQGFTIRGVQRLLKDKGVAFVVSVGQTGAVQTVTAIDGDDADEAPAPRSSRVRIEPALESIVEHEEPTPQAAAGPVVATHTMASAPVKVIAALAVDQRRRLELALSELVEAKDLLERAL